MLSINALKSYISCALFVIFFFHLSFAQQHKTNFDDLQNYYNKVRNEAGKISLDTSYVAFSKILVDLDKLTSLDKEEQKIATSIYEHTLVRLLWVHTAKRDYDSCQYYGERIKKEVKDPLLLSIAFKRLMVVELRRGNYKKAIHYIQRHEETLSSINENSEMYALKFSLYLYIDIGALDLAEELINTLEADIIHLKNSSKHKISFLLKKAEYFQKKSNYQTSLQLLKSIDEQHFFVNQSTAKFYYDLLSRIYLNDNAFEQALYYAKKAYMDKRLATNSDTLKKVILFASIYLKMEDYSKALNMIKESEKVPFSFGTLEKRELFRLTYLIYKAKKSPQLALEYHEKYTQIRDSIDSQKVIIQSMALNTKLKKEKKLLVLEEANKRKALVIENQNKTFISIIIVSFLSVAFISLVAYFYRKKKRLKLLFELENTKKIAEAKSHFLENISHEFRTPITIIIGYLNLIKTKKLAQPKMLSYIDAATKNSQNMVDSLNNFLTLLKFEKKTFDIRKTEKPFLEFVSDIVRSFQATAEVKRISLYFKSNIKKETTLEFDYSSLQKILNNLISNAIKYTHQNKVIYVKVFLEDEGIVIKVKDEGIGIPSNELKNIFSRFYQSKTHTIYGGFGIGLSLTKELVENMKGSIEVESKEYYGSVFTVNIPIKEIDHSFLTQEIEPDYVCLTEVLDQNKVTIIKKLPTALVVEDNIEMTSYLKEILTPHLNCTFAYDGQRGLEIAKSHLFDIVITDLRIPLLDGLELKSELNNIPHYKQSPFIIITATPTAIDIRNKSSLTEKYDYILKPFLEIEIINRIQVLLGKDIYKNKLLDVHENALSLTDNTFTFMSSVNEAILDNYHDSNFNIKKLGEIVKLSPRQLRDTIQSATGLTPVKAILEIRLLKAYELLKRKKFSTLKEVVFAVGLNSRDYFNKAFFKRFGIKPKEITKIEY